MATGATSAVTRASARINLQLSVMFSRRVCSSNVEISGSMEECYGSRIDCGMEHRHACMMMLHAQHKTRQEKEEERRREEKKILVVVVVQQVVVVITTPPTKKYISSSIIIASVVVVICE